MATAMVIGSKTGIFHLNRTAWKCRTELESDVLVEVGDFSFFLHKFPLINASPILRNLIAQSSCQEHNLCTLCLDEFPGGPRYFELVAKFCYGEKFELTSSNAVPVICAAYYLGMNEEYMTGNLALTAANFLLNKVLSNWQETLIALRSCKHVLPIAEKLDIVSTCLDSLASKATNGRLSCPVQNQTWNGIECGDVAPLNVNESGSDWWFDDMSSLRLPLFKRFVGLLGAKGHDPANISSAVIYYWNKVHPGLNPNSTGVYLNDLRLLLEEMVALLPVQKGVTPTKTLLSLLSTSLMYNANVSCIESLEKRIGAQLDESILEDLLVPNLQGPYDTKYVSSKKNESKYDIDCIQRIIEQFVKENLHESEITIDSEGEEGSMEDHSQELGRVGAVANLVDEYLRKIATDAKLNFRQFQSLASAIPSSARSSNDNLYHAIDVYLQHHPSLSEQQKEQLCQLLDIRRLSREACQDVALNEKLPLRVVVKVLFNELVHLKTSLNEHGTETLIETELTTEIGTGDETGIVGRMDLLWQRMKIQKNYDILKKLIKRVEKAKVAQKNWKLIFCRNLRSVSVGKALPASRER